MKFKIDENLPQELAKILLSAGHDAETVYSERLQGGTDPDLMKVCVREERALVTLDLDFADIRAYPPKSCPGIMVLRVARQDKAYVMSIFRRAVRLLEKEEPRHRLWIIEDFRVRIHEGA